jgi:hypothetical protein
LSAFWQGLSAPFLTTPNGAGIGLNGLPSLKLLIKILCFLLTASNLHDEIEKLTWQPTPVHALREHAPPANATSALIVNFDLGGNLPWCPRESSLSLLCCSSLRWATSRPPARSSFRGMAKQSQTVTT